MKAFPDPSSSPAHHARTLAIFGIKLVAAASTNVRRWIRAFHSIVHLHMSARGWDDRISLTPFHGLSPTVKSLCLKCSSVPPSETLNLVCSFPLLEDLTFIPFGHETEADEWTTPLTSPKLTGSLTVSSVVGWVGSTVRRLINLPNGLRFTKIVLVWVWDADPKSSKGFGDAVFRDP